MGAMASTEKILEAMRREPRNVRFADLFKVCVEHFGSRVSIQAAMPSSRCPGPATPV